MTFFLAAYTTKQLPMIIRFIPGLFYSAVQMYNKVLEKRKVS